MIYDDPEDDLGNDLSPEERAVTRREPYSDDCYDMEMTEGEWLAELREIDDQIAQDEAEEKQRRSNAARKGWSRRREKKPRRVKKQLRSIDDPWLG